MIPSLLQIPSAVSNSKLHSVLPNNGKGDFQFDRSTGATRINKDGLIEELGYFSSELVQNGNFSELGSELVTNGDFATNSDWGFPNVGGWSISNEKAIANFSVGTTGRLTQNINFTQNKTYKVVFTISDYEQGTIRIEFRHNGGSKVSAHYSGNGTYTLYQKANHNNTQLSVRGLGDAVLKLNNISVKEVDPNDRWTVSGVDIALDTNGIKITTNDSSNGGIYQAVTTVVGSNYRLKLDFVAGNVNGIVQVGTSVFGGELYQNTSVTSNLIINFTATATTTYINLRVAASGATDKHCFYNNVSVVEVQGDRPRLSYDITNGVVEKQPHLLLEPSSTNLVSDSNNQNDSWFKTNVTFSKNTVTSPDGTQNASTLDFSAIDGMFRFITASGNPDTKTFTASVYLKAGTATSAKIRILGSSGGLGMVSQNVTLTSDWQRFSVTSTFSGTGDNVRIRVQSLEVGTMYFFGGQVEEQSFATSLIPTAGTTITRAAETCNNSKPSINSTEGVLYVEAKALVDGLSSREISLSSGSSSNTIRLRYSADVSRFQAFMRSGGGTIQALSRSAKPQDVYRKIAIEYNSTEFAMWIDGTKEATVTTTSTPVGLNKLEFELNGSLFFYGKVKGLAVYNEALTDAQLIELTS